MSQQAIASRFWNKLARFSSRQAAIEPPPEPPAPVEPQPTLSPEEAAYQARLSKEQEIYHLCTNVHELPDIFHYWSDTYIRPKLEAFGFSSPHALFEFAFEKHLNRADGKPQRFVSIGSGNCDLEVHVARVLKAAGHRNFVLECLDLNPAMLDRGRQMAAEAGVTELVQFTKADFNRWQPEHTYNGVMANQAIHHVENLEGLFVAIKAALAPGGIFVTSDMIGRNGHQRWPEALEIVHELWRTLPGNYRINQQLKRYEELFENWDCSGEGFEGIRSQDILPLLLQHFQFRMFLAFGNLIDPFVDRMFGHNFRAETDWDREFIDRIHRRDEAEQRKGTIKPTHMLAIMTKEPTELVEFEPPFTPEFCVRWP